MKKKSILHKKIGKIKSKKLNKGKKLSKNKILTKGWIFKKKEIKIAQLEDDKRFRPKKKKM